MKITKSQLRRLIKEELEDPRQPRGIGTAIEETRQIVKLANEMVEEYIHKYPSPLGPPVEVDDEVSLSMEAMQDLASYAKNLLQRLVNLSDSRS